MTSNLPPGGGFSYTREILHRCPKCGHEWHVYMLFELGGWFYFNDDDAFCEKCGTEGVAE